MQAIQRRLAIGAIALLGSSALFGGSLSVVLDNDVLFNSDDAYSGGIIVNWMSEEYRDPSASKFSRTYMDGYRELLDTLVPGDVDRSYRNASPK